MKLSDLSTDAALDTLCELTGYVANITSDSAFSGPLQKVDADGLSLYGMYVLLIGRASELIPVLLKSHRDDVYGILAVVNQKRVEDIRAQSAGETVRQLRELFHDQELLDFFKSFTRRGRSEPSAPSAPSQDSE